MWPMRCSPMRPTDSMMMHTLRGGIFIQSDHSKSETSSAVIALDDAGNQISDIPVNIVDNGAKTEWIESLYLQDEWKVIPTVTFNYGVRFDKFTAFASGHQVSPRVNVVWQALDDTTVHAGYSRYFSPPPFELVGTETVSKFVNTTAAAEVHAGRHAAAGAGQLLRYRCAAEVHPPIHRGPRHLLQAIAQLDRRRPIRGAHHLDALQLHLRQTVWRRDHRQFTRQEGFNAYLNLAYQSATGKNIDSAQFNFGADDLAYIASHYIHLDHEQEFTASGGVSYLWNHTHLQRRIS